MPGDLTLPGDIPNLLRRGSPVVPAYREAWLETSARGLRSSATASALVRESTSRGVVHLSEGWGNTHVEAVALDLTDATGRQHARWYVAERVGLNPEDIRFSVGRADGKTFVHANDGRTSREWVFDDLDPDDAIEALRRVALHVAGRLS